MKWRKKPSTSIAVGAYEKKKKYTESIVKSQNIVEQANSNPNNISPTMSRRHIICKSSSVAEMNHKFHS